jgi:hypothetical protein
MKIKLGELKNAETSLQKLIEKDLNIKIAYKLGKLIKIISAEFKEIEDSRVKLIKKYGKEDENKNIQVLPENNEKFYIEFQQLLDEEIDIDFEPLALEELGEISMTTTDVLKLGHILK